MTSTTFFIIFVPILAVLLLAINLILAPHNPYQEKDSVFECGFHSFLGQNRTQFSISFFIFALLFLLFDLEIVLIYPYSVSSYTNDIYGLIIMMVFFVLLTLGFIFELGKNALTIDSRQTSTIYSSVDTTTGHAYLVKSSMIPGISDVLYNLQVSLDKYVCELPSARRLKRLGHNDQTEINNIVKEKMDMVNSLHSQVTERANLEMSQPNIRSEIFSQLETYLSNADSAKQTGISLLTESVRVIMDSGLS